MGTIIDRTGQRFGRLTVIKFGGLYKNRQSVWHCTCDCGNEVDVLASNLVTGKSNSCGCFRKEVTIARSTKHGNTINNKVSSEYRCWANMVNRCTNEKYREYHYYGGRGITVCQRWEKSFENFHADMGNKPSPNHSLDRIDVNGNYSPENCRWSTSSEQSLNRRVPKSNKSGFVGVHWNKKQKTWTSYISFNRERIYLGSFKEFDKAVEARKKAELKYEQKQPS